MSLELCTVLLCLSSRTVMRFALLPVGALIASAVAAPSLNHVLHEKRDRLPLGWGQAEELDGMTVLPMKIALTQSNLDKADEFLMDVSHPSSPNFGQHWSAKKIAETFAPSRESLDSVTQWLKSSGIAPERISKSQSLGWLQFDATVEEAENLLKTKYRKYTHSSGKPHVAVGYLFPAFLVLLVALHVIGDISQQQLL